MKLNKILVALTATLCVTSAQASVIAFNPVGGNVTQSTNLYWDMLSNAIATSPMGTIGNFVLSSAGDIGYNPATANFVNTGANSAGANLTLGTLINSASNWGDNSGSVGTTLNNGGCAMGQTCIYGLSFVMAGNTHYGWVQFKEINPNRQHLMTWAYESTARTAIGAGVAVSAIADPIQAVPEPVSLGLLGIGLAGLALSRRKMAAKAA